MSQRPGARRRRARRPDDHASCPEPVSAPPFELRRPELNAQLPTLLDHAAVSLRHPARRAVAAIAAASVAGLPLDARCAAASPRCSPRRSSPRRPRAAPTCSRSTGSAGGPILAQSPQFYKQIMVGVFERVYEVGPVFRAEPHDTARHLAQYLSLDAEIGLHHRPPRRHGRPALRARRHGRGHRRARPTGPRPARADAPGRPRRDPGRRVPRGAGDDRARHRRPTLGEPDLSPADERWLGDWARARARLGVRVRHRLPDGEAAVLHPPRPGDPAASNSFDLLFRGLELVTGGQRLHRFDDYARRPRRPRPRTRSTATSKRSATACRRTAASPSGSNAGSPGSPAPPTSAKSTLFPRDINRLTP